MGSYKILTDSGCDLNREMAQSLDIKIVPMTVNFRGQTLDDSVDSNIQELYQAWRKGEPASTAAVNPDRWEKEMEPVLKNGSDLLVLAFSSGLSTTYQSAEIAAADLRDKYPERKISVVDTRSASLGQGLLVWYACQKRDQGMSLEEITAWAKEIRFHLCHWFTVDDLMYLKRGGRISAATAVVGTMLKIKPVLHMDDPGHLINMSKARGRKASIEAMANKVADLGEGYDNSTMFICHGDCIEDAKYLEKLVREKYGVKNVVIGYTGAVIGSHSGPGTLALFFLGKNR